MEFEPNLISVPIDVSPTLLLKFHAQCVYPRLAF